MVSLQQILTHIMERNFCQCCRMPLTDEIREALLLDEILHR